ncbi:MAG: hypothetical protein GDA49_09425 [Rhodospirillales bacterium]|nr:hypothetical protein [Rhodospirillales bacterium]
MSDPNEPDNNARLRLRDILAVVGSIKACAHAPVSWLVPFAFLPLPLLPGGGLLFGQSMPMPMMIGLAAVIPVWALLALREIVLVRRAYHGMLARFD